MKTVLIMMVSGCLAGCALATTGEHDWLGEDERTQWQEVSLSVLGREVRFSVPDKSSGIGMQTRIESFVANENLNDTFEYPEAWQGDSFRRIVTFYWDRSWGGFYKSSEWDFTLDVQVRRDEGDTNLLELSSDQRVQRETLEKRDRYRDSTGWPSEEWFFDRYRVRTYENQQSQGWVVQNVPQVLANHEEYALPITPDHELTFSFFVAEKRMGGPATEEWQASRWAIAQRIMESVTVDPPPFE